MIDSHHSKLSSFLETRVKTPIMGDLYLNVCPNWCFTTNLSHHSNGRIIVSWELGSCLVDILLMTSQMIHCHVTPRGTWVCFFRTFVYGLNTKRGREPLWRQLQVMADVCNEAWIIMGDFNAIMELEDRISTVVRIGEVLRMRNCMNYCCLTEVKTVGRHFMYYDNDNKKNYYLFEEHIC